MEKKHESAKKHNVVKYRKPLNINIGFVIFGVMFIYIIFCIITYMQSTHIIGYEVNEGALTTTKNYTGIALRDEKVITSSSSGFVNYFAMEGQRIGAFHLLYAIDGSGRLSSYIEKGNSEVKLSNEDLKNVRQDCISFASSFSPNQFQSVYTFKNSLKSSAILLSGANTLDSIYSINDTSITNSLEMAYAPESGIVEYYLDGFEETLPEQISETSFDESVYNKKMFMTGDLIGEGDPVYKLVTSENWKLIIPLNEEQASELKDETVLKVKFIKNQKESYGNFSILNNASGTYGVLEFNNSMIAFADERFIEIELILNEIRGLKIPKSSIVEKDFFLIPENYVFDSDDSQKKCVYKQVYTPEGQLTWSKEQVNVYGDDDGKMYISTDDLSGGDLLSKPDSNDTITVSDKGSLVGVYNINKGYADFREITILEENEDYAIVKSNSYYGLCEYDHIVLDAESVSDDDFMN